jgi:hypothetical protein
MSVSYGSSIATSGLVLYLDAVNSKSNNGTTTWYDLSPSKVNGSMYGTVPTSVDGGGCFDFATVSGASSGAASLGFTFASNMIPLTGSFTLNTWIKNPPTNAGQCGLFSNAGGANGYRFGIGRDACYVLMAGASGEGYSEPQLSFSSTLNTTSWYNVCMVFDRVGTNSGGTPQWQLYLNGVYQTATNMGTPQTAAMTTTAPGLVRSACCGLYTGKIATFSAYGRALSATEILQNFNSLRGRFGA